MKDLLDCIKSGMHLKECDNDGFCVQCGNQEVFPYAISTSDGHDEDWSYYKTEEEAYDSFESMKANESDIHLYEFNYELGYEVIDSWSSEDDNFITFNEAPYGED